MKHSSFSIFSFLKNGLFTFLLCFFIVACTNKNNKQDKYVVDKEVMSITLVGDLRHVTYWDKHDDWDISNLQLLVVYADETSDQIPAVNDFCVYSFSPVKPAAGVHSFDVVDSYLVDSLGTKHPIDNRHFVVAVSKYPYPDTVVEFLSMASGIIIIVSSLIVFSVFALKRKELF